MKSCNLILEKTEIFPWWVKLMAHLRFPQLCGGSVLGSWGISVPAVTKFRQQYITL